MSNFVDSYGIDSHKLMFHPQRVAAWMAGEVIYPLYAEISPAGACNHRCTFCALDYLGYRPRFLDAALLKERLSEMAAGGVRSVMFGGEGEPLLHREIGGLIDHARGAGIDVAVTTNGVLLTEELFRQAGGSLSWLKVSINAGTPATYAAIHRTDAADFERVVAQLQAAVRIAGENGYSCTIGAQMILLPENAHEAEQLADICREIGLAYLVIKPYSQHGRSLTRVYEQLDYTVYLSLAKRLERFNDGHFRVIFRTNAMRKLDLHHRGYARCLALPFWAYIDSLGGVWGCSAHLGDERFCYGNIARQSFAEIWEGEKRRSSLAWVAEHLDPQTCRLACRMDEINRYLWELQHPGAHVNFI